jgi:hypothetical protein
MESKTISPVNQADVAFKEERVFKKGKAVDKKHNSRLLLS